MAYISSQKPCAAGRSSGNGPVDSPGWRALRWLCLAAFLGPISVWADGPAPAAPAAAAPTVKVVSNEQDTVVVDAKTEDVIKGALEWLSTQQETNGSWTATGKEHPVAMTGYALMAYLASGNLPNGGQFSRQVTNGVQYLLRNVRDDGFINSSGPTGGGKPSNMYDHGIATIALGEVYGQSQDPAIKAKLTAAIKLIVGCQNDEGGWRYNPRPESADISVTVLQVVALRCAKNSGLDVPQSTIDRAVQFVKTCYDARSGGFTYQPHNNAPGFSRTAAAIYSLQVCGIYDDPEIATGSKYLQAQLTNSPKSTEYWTYGSFYAMPAEYMIGGNAWKQWYGHTSAVLLENVQSPGGAANGTTLRFWRGLDGNAGGLGPVYATAVYSAMLALPYHYLPLYQR